MHKLFRKGVATSILLMSLLTIGSNASQGQSVIPLSVSFYYPTNGETYTAPATVAVHALVLDSTLVKTVQYFANGTNIGTRTNTGNVVLTNSSTGNPFELNWSNVVAGVYSLTAVATDAGGTVVTSAPVNITVKGPPVIPLTVSFYYPTNGQTYTAPAIIAVHALVLDSTLVKTVQYFANGTNIGTRTNTGNMVLTNSSEGNPFELVWSNVVAGAYSLTAVATDAGGTVVTSAPVNITVKGPPVIPLTVSFYYPTNGETYTAPAIVALHALVLDSTLVKTVQYFANGTNIGTRTNTGNVMLTNSSTGNPFELSWSNVVAGAYSLTAVATDASGTVVTSTPVNITVKGPPVIPLTVSFYYPTNGQTYTAPAIIAVHALVLDTTLVKTVQYFANGTNIGTRTNTGNVVLTNSSTGNPFELSWNNVVAGAYSLTAVATDAGGTVVTSAPVNITVKAPPLIPLSVRFYYPTNGQFFPASTTIGVQALVLDSTAVKTVQYFANGTSIGIVTNTAGVVLTNSTSSNPFFLAWSNVLAGNYALTAVATDASGTVVTSAPVSIIVVSNWPPTVSIYAPDPVAVEGTNSRWFTTSSSATNYCSGSNTATFLVLRNSATNVNLTVDYSIGGTASNGVDYVMIPNEVTIPDGHGYALITISPLNDTNTVLHHNVTVVLTLSVPPPPTNTLPAYFLGSPQKAGAVILEENALPILQPMARFMADGSIHASLPATNGMNFCLQYSTDLVNWFPVCTNTVLKGSAQYVDPDGAANSKLFYRAVPVASPPSY